LPIFLIGKDLSLSFFFSKYLDGIKSKKKSKSFSQNTLTGLKAKRNQRVWSDKKTD
jgi:hypothetical protein